WDVCTLEALCWHRLSSRLQGRSTLRAELGGGRRLLATTRAELYERRPALNTELRSFRILCTTARTAHAASLLPFLPFWQGCENRVEGQRGGSYYGPQSGRVLSGATYEGEQ